MEQQQHTWVVQDQDELLINGKPPTTKYFVCQNCWIIKAVRDSGKIDFIFNDGSPYGKILKSEPACLTVINGGKNEK
jgi:hypothetical protein